MGTKSGSEAGGWVVWDPMSAIWYKKRAGNASEQGSG